MGSSGANSTEYLRMTFDKNTYSITKEAVYDMTNQTYQIDGKNVSESEVKSYVEKWNKKEDVSWSK